MIILFSCYLYVHLSCSSVDFDKSANAIKFPELFMFVQEKLGCIVILHQNPSNNATIFTIQINTTYGFVLSPYTMA